MLRRAPFVLIPVVAALMGTGLRGGPASVSAQPRPCAPAPVLSRAPGVAAGRGIVAVSGNRLISIGAGVAARPAMAEAAPGPGMVRHVAAAPGRGTAYVLDRHGADTLVIRRPSGVRTLPQPGEVTHPAWSPRGDLAWSVGTALRVLQARGGGLRRIPVPVAGARVFSPVFATAERLLAVVSAPPTEAVPEDERLNNLWRYDLARGRWARVTRFTAGADRWTAIRTPLRLDDGSLAFVRIDGRGSATRMPTFHLWSLSHGRAAPVRQLAGERYLAAQDAGRLVWDVPDPTTGVFRLVREDAPGRETLIGCGAVMVDPLDAVDPDRRAGPGRYTPARGDWTGLDTPPSETSQAAPRIGILVGDYDDPSQARAAAARIRAAYGPGAPVALVDAVSAPDAIVPGKFGAMLRLREDADPEAALVDFRTRLPEYATSSWVVSP